MKEDVSELCTSVAYTYLLFCKRCSISVCTDIYLSVPPSLAISTSSSSIGDGINRTRIVATEYRNGASRLPRYGWPDIGSSVDRVQPKGDASLSMGDNMPILLPLFKRPSDTNSLPG